LQNLASIVAAEDLPRAIQYARDAVDAVRELGDTRGESISQLNLVIALAYSGDWDEILQSVADEVHRSVDLEIDLCQRIVAVGRNEPWPAVAELADEDPESMDLVERRVYLLDRALEAQAAGSPDAVTLALDSVHDAEGPGVGVEEFVFCWLHASDLVRRDGGRDDLDRLLELVHESHGPWPAAVKAQRAHLRAVAGEDGSSTIEQVERSYREALDAVRAWGSVPFEAHICADFGDWLLRQGQHAEGTELVDRARQHYVRLGATRWLESMDRGVAVAEHGAAL